jgi:uncharacterized protein
MAAFTIALALLALLGHAALWVGFVNRIHATGASRSVVKLFSTSGHLLLAGLPIAAAVIWWNSNQSLLAWLTQAAQCPAIWFYLELCWLIAVVAIVLWIYRNLLTAAPQAVLSRRTATLDIGGQLSHKPLKGWFASSLSFVPGNQVLRLCIDELQLALPRLPAQLDGLSIAQLSDLHITGRVGIDFFQEVVRQTNALGADIIAITGDIIDEIELFDWIPQGLAHLSAPLGVYFVLGNHDQFTGEATRLRQMLTEAGFLDLGNQWRRLEVASAEIILAGNELPWFSPAPEMQKCPARSIDHPQWRVLLSHSPDQFAWARRYDFDLMLAGHAHGGQIRLPLVGPIFCPSRHGVKYACGTFYANPTLMHVSRGLSSELPLRLNCPPELTKIILHPNTPGAAVRMAV